MAIISYDAYIKQKEEREKPKVGYFALANDGDEAVVRIMHDSVEDFDMMAVHPFVINGKHRNVNCLRTPQEPMEKCPFCEAHIPLRSRIYFHLLEYTKAADGTISATPKLWDRALSSFGPTLSNLLKEYGPLSAHIFKIKRSGAAKSVDTTYSIMYGAPTIYREDMYIPQPDAFKDIKALGNAVIDMDAEEMRKKLAENPQLQSVSQQSVQQPTVSQVPQQPIQQPETYTQQTPPVELTVTKAVQPAEETDTTIPRPRRYY